MDKNMKTDVMEAWAIFMKLSEEFPELYDKYVEKVENEMKNYKPDFEITEDDRIRAWEKLQERIKNENL